MAPPHICVEQVPHICQRNLSQCVPVLDWYTDAFGTPDRGAVDVYAWLR